MSAIAAAVDAIFDDKTVAKGARWRAGGGATAVPCRVTLAEPDEVIGVGKARVVVAAKIVDVRRREIANPAVGDEVDILDDADAVVETLKIVAQPRVDSEQEVWGCEATEA